MRGTPPINHMIFQIKYLEIHIVNQDKYDGTPQNALSTFFDYATIAVSDMIQKWEQILEYFDNLITEKTAFLDPLKHDNLLVDDETFSRSERYFWAISTLKKLDAVISENIQQVSKLINQTELTTVEGDEVRFLEGSRKHMRGRLGQLEEIAKRLRDKRQEALDLRDGVSATSYFMRFVRLIILLSSFSMPVVLWRVVPQLDWEKMSSY